MRASVLRHYYEKSFVGDHKDLYAGADFDEFYALLRRQFPRMPKWIAASRGPALGRPDLENEMARFDRTERADTRTPLQRLEAEHPVVHLVRKKKVDLREHVRDARVRGLECERDEISGWSALRVPPEWERIEVRGCTTNVPEHVDPVRAREVVLVSSDDDCLYTLARDTRARSFVVINHERHFDLAALRGHDELEEVTAMAVPRAHGVRHLRPERLRVLELNAPFDEELERLVRASAASLESLGFGLGDAPRPKSLPTMPRLCKLTVPATPELRDAWIDFGCAHPDLDLRFVPRDTAPSFEVSERVGDVDVVECPAPKTTYEAFVVRPLKDIEAIIAAGKSEKRKLTHRRIADGSMLSSTKLQDVVWAAQR